MLYSVPAPSNVFCAYGWIIITQRVDASLSFNRTWSDYKLGFGSVTAAGNFWIGLEKFYQMTNSGSFRLRFLLRAAGDGNWYNADYDSIVVQSEVNKYKWHFGNYSGNAGDALRYDTGQWNLQDMKFTTCDSWNDLAPSNCGCKWSNGWWMNYCYQTSLNGVYGTAGYEWCAKSQPAGFGSAGQLIASTMMIQRN